MGLPFILSFELVEQSKDATLSAGQLALMGCQISSAGTLIEKLRIYAVNSGMRLALFSGIGSLVISRKRLRHGDEPA